MTRVRSLPTAFLVALAPFLMLVARFNFVTDDAFISFRYSRNFAAGLGLRYNEGVDPPVEGFSNFLWVAWCALFELAHLDVTVVARVSSVACGVLLLWRVARFLERRVCPTGAGAATCGALLLATLPPFAVWSTSGLATMPFALFLFLAFEALVGDPNTPRGWRAGLAFLGAVLVRADGPVFVALIVAAVGATWLLRGRPAALIRATCVATVCGVLGFAALVAWRYGYYGELTPNTAQVKVGMSWSVLHRGANYVMVFLLSFLGVPLVGIGAWLRARVDAADARLAASTFLLGTLAYAVFVGGDFMAMHRFLVPALPFVAILGAVAFQGITQAGARYGVAGAAVLLGLLPAWNVHVVPHSVRSVFHFRWRVDELISEYERWEQQRENTASWSRVGKALAQHTRPGESLVIPQIGAIGYFSGLRILDRRGLVHRQVAREVAPEGRHSPGHGIRAPLSFFEDETPTYASAQIVKERAAKAFARKRMDALFGEFPDDAPLREHYESAFFPLSEADGFEPETTLWVARRVE